jgi:glycosyltransferase involved in cell wall biosynthesis
MNITVISAYFEPQQSAGANRMLAYINCFIESGWKATVIAPRYSSTNLTKKSSHFDPSDIKNKKIEIIRACRINNQTKSFVIRFLYETSKSIKLLYSASRIDSKYYLVTTPFLSLLLLSPLFLPAQKLIIDIRDLTWEYSISDRWYVTILQKLLAYLSIKQLRQVFMIVTTTEGEKNYILEKCPRSKIIHIPNGIDQKTFNSLRTLKKTERLDKIVFYAGTLGYAQGLEILIDVAIRMPEWKFRIAGDGASLPSLKKIIDSKKISNIELLGKITRDDVIKNYKDASILFMRLRKGFDTAIPSKLYEYIATGRQILLMGDPEGEAWKVAQIFENIGFTRDGDFLELEKQIKIFHNSGLIISQKNILLIEKNFIRESSVKKLVDFINNINKTRV